MIIENSKIYNILLSINFHSFIKGFEGVNKEILLGISAILFSLLLPLTIFLVEDAKNKNFIFDRAVIMTKIIKPKVLALSIICLTFSLLLPKSFFIIFYIVGLILYCFVLIGIFKWMNLKGRVSEEIDLNDNFKSQARLNYIENIKEFSDSIQVWNNLWRDKNNRKDFDERILIKNFIKFYNDNYVESENILGRPGPKVAISKIRNKEEMDEILDEIINYPKTLKMLINSISDKILKGDKFLKENKSYIFIYKKCLNKFIELQAFENEERLEKNISLHVAIFLKEISYLNEEDKYLILGIFKEELISIDFERCLTHVIEYSDNKKAINNISDIIEKHYKYKDEKELAELGRSSGLSSKIEELLHKYPFEL